LSGEKGKKSRKMRKPKIIKELNIWKLFSREKVEFSKMKRKRSCCLIRRLRIL